MHLIIVESYEEVAYELVWISDHILGNSKSLAQVGFAQQEKDVEALKLILIKHGINEDIEPQEESSFIYCNLEYRNAVLSRGMQH